MLKLWQNSLIRGNCNTFIVLNSTILSISMHDIEKFLLHYIDTSPYVFWSALHFIAFQGHICEVAVLYWKWFFNNSSDHSIIFITAPVSPSLSNCTWGKNKGFKSRNIIYFKVQIQEESLIILIGKHAKLCQLINLTLKSVRTCWQIIHSKKPVRYKVDRNILNWVISKHFSQLFSKKNFAKIKTQFRVQISNLIKQWQQLETYPSDLHLMFIIAATP